MKMEHQYWINEVGESHTRKSQGDGRQRARFVVVIVVIMIMITDCGDYDYDYDDHYDIKHTGRLLQ